MKTIEVKNVARNFTLDLTDGDDTDVQVVGPQTIDLTYMYDEDESNEETDVNTCRYKAKFESIESKNTVSEDETAITHSQFKRLTSEQSDKELEEQVLPFMRDTRCGADDWEFIEFADSDEEQCAKQNEKVTFVVDDNSDDDEESEAKTATPPPEESSGEKGKNTDIKNERKNDLFLPKTKPVAVRPEQLAEIRAQQRKKKLELLEKQKEMEETSKRSSRKPKPKPPKKRPRSLSAPDLQTSEYASGTQSDLQVVGSPLARSGPRALQQKNPPLSPCKSEGAHDRSDGEGGEGDGDDLEEGDSSDPLSKKRRCQKGRRSSQYTKWLNEIKSYNQSMQQQWECQAAEEQDRMFAEARARMKPQIEKNMQERLIQEEVEVARLVNLREWFLQKCGWDTSVLPMEKMWEVPDPLSKDPYKCLGISSDASKVDVERHYRKLALMFHPDKNPRPDAYRVFCAFSAARHTLKKERSATWLAPSVSTSSTTSSQSSASWCSEKLF